MSRPFRNEDEPFSVQSNVLRCTRKCPRRYVMALVLCVLLLIEFWKNFTILFTIIAVIYPIESAGGVSI